MHVAEPRLFDLGIDTVSDDASLAILEGDAVVAQRAWRATSTVSRELLQELDELLRAAGIDRRAIARIAVDIGPGQYGAVRSGIATAQGLALALDVPLAGVPRLDADAWPLVAAGGTVVSVHDIRNMVAWAAYGVGPDGLPAQTVAPRIDTPAEAARLAPRPATWCGEVADVLAAAQDAEGRSGDTVVRSSEVPRAVTLVRIAQARGLFVDPAAVDALYLRAPSISQPRPR